ncbi:hypothetical protein [Paractinoplanes toevensis]|uniref:Uncharacterized protein n=1 Tax=Paractinoplanes toevensis TaxID=571911 RepID=A0A920BQU4_9ACTN|nr:hypothetical protein [Actinoplanes toevensis]GIM97440.1 hypothetical protein Ato02nite_092330 [Actinoplanes toevensis]
MRIYAERSKGAGPPPAEALVGVARELESRLGVGRFEYAGHPARRIFMRPAEVDTWLGQVRSDRRRGEAALFTLGTDPSLSAGAILTYEEEPWTVNAVEWVWCGLPHPDPVTAMLDLVSAVAHRFGAHRAVVEDDDLLTRYRGARAAERARAQLPPELRRYVPDPPAADGGLPSLLVPQEFDRRRVPDAVWWVNCWDAVQVATVGAARIRRAPWRHIVELPAGGMALAASENPPDPADPADLSRLAALVAALDLRAVQLEHRLPQA